MFKIELKIDRIVSQEEVEAFSKFASLLRKGDILTITPLMEDRNDASPVAPSKPVIVPEPRRHRSWSEILGTAFAKTLNAHPDHADEIEALRNSLAWSECDRSDWVPYKKTELAETTGGKDNALAYTLVYSVLKFLGRQPVSAAKEILLPPTMMTWTRTKEREQKEQEEANLRLTGDPHIGFPIHERKTTAVTPPEILFEKLNELDWKSKDRCPMTIRKFMEMVHLPFTRGNAVRLGIVARNEFGGLEKVEQTKDGVVFAFPLPKIVRDHTSS